MKRDSTCNVSIATEHPFMAEDANLKITYTPGRDGGTFGLPLGAKIVVGEGVCVRREWVTCQVASPAQRWRHSPCFPEDHVISEIFTLTGNILKQRSSFLILPYRQPQGKYLQLNVKAMWSGHNSWVDVPFVQKTDTPLPCVELEIDKMGTFLVTYRSKTEPLQVTPQGGLFHSRLNRNISLRFPKRAVDATIEYDLQITEVPADCVAFCKEYFSTACFDLLHASEFVDLRPSHFRCHFRRPATIKLPLPEGVEGDDKSANQIAVLHKPGENWEWVDGRYKFTRNSVTFDVKNPTKFCVIHANPNRQRKMQEAATVLEQRVGKDQAELTLFLSLKDKSWLAVVESYPLGASPAKLRTRQDQGFVAVQKREPPENPTPDKRFSSRRPPPVGRRPAKRLEGFEMHDGLTWTLEVAGDVQATPKSETVSGAGLQCFRHLPDSYRQFGLEPVDDEERDLQATLTLTPQGVEDPDLKDKLTFVFDVEVPEEAVKRYLLVPPSAKPAPQPKPPRVAEARAGTVPEPPPKPAPPPAPKKRVFTFSQTPMERLTQLPKRFNPRQSISTSLAAPTAESNLLYWNYRRIGFIRPPITVDKEPKVLSGRSLMTLSKLMENGVALAIELGLKESTVSGIGFDAMSSSRSLSDMTYKILLYWKRTCRPKHDAAVQELVGALRQLGKHSLAQIVLDRHRQNLELTMDCFLDALVSGVDLSV